MIADVGTVVEPDVGDTVEVALDLIFLLLLLSLELELLGCLLSLLWGFEIELLYFTILSTQFL